MNVFMKITLIIPVFNERDAVPFFYQATKSHLALSKYQVELVFVDDGSVDGTAEIIGFYAKSDPRIKLIELSRNFGKEAAMLAGLDHASGDVVIPIDVDLQDPLDVIPQLVERYKAGFDVVLAKRIDRSSDGVMKRGTAKAFYWVHNKISPLKIESNVGDFRLMSRQVVEAVKQMPERQVFMKGMLSWVGFNTDVVEYVRGERVAGKSKFSVWKLWGLAVEGITSFSTVPLKVWSYLGVLAALISFIYAAIIVVDKIFFGIEVSGYASTMVAVLFLGGVQLIGIGVLGEYVGRVYMESKKRPRYIVKKVVSLSHDQRHLQEVKL